ncbi:L-threonylcarbamoyladenylate synthase [Mariniluteicoccus flavus]
MTDHSTPDETSDTPEPSDVLDEAASAYATFDLAGDDRDAGLEAARDAVSSGRCIVLPTDTVYGIGADAFNAGAVQGLLDAKGRGRDMPPPVLVADPAVMMALGTDIPDAAKKLAEQFWPGALTLILKAQPSLSMDLGDTAGTIAVRVPDHDGARELLRRTGPLAVSSANRSGEPAAMSAGDAAEQLGDRVAVYLDGGATSGPEPSTIVDFSRSTYGKVLRDGRIGLDELRALVPYLDGPDPEPEPEPEQTYAGSLGLGSWNDEQSHAEAAKDPDDVPPTAETPAAETPAAETRAPGATAVTDPTTPDIPR